MHLTLPVTVLECPATLKNDPRLAFLRLNVSPNYLLGLCFSSLFHVIWILEVVDKSNSMLNSWDVGTPGWADRVTVWVPLDPQVCFFLAWLLKTQSFLQEVQKQVTKDHFSQ